MLPRGKIARNHFTIRKRERERRLGFHPRRRIGGFEASRTQIVTATGFLDHEGTDLATRPRATATTTALYFTLYLSRSLFHLRSQSVTECLSLSLSLCLQFCLFLFFSFSVDWCWLYLVTWLWLWNFIFAEFAYFSCLVRNDWYWLYLVTWHWDFIFAEFACFSCLVRKLKVNRYAIGTGKLVTGKH